MATSKTDTHNSQQEAQAALALVNANKPLAPPPDPSNPSGQEQRQHHHTPTGIISWTAAPAKFDKLGRRILTPPITRSNSSQGAGSGTPFVPGTPVISGASTPRESQVRTRNSPSAGHCILTYQTGQPEDDVARASSLMQLYEIRARLKQQDTTSLNKTRERVNAIQARQQMTSPTSERRDAAEGHHSRFTYPKTP